MHINLQIEKPALFPWQNKHCTVQFSAVLPGHGYFVQLGYLLICRVRHRNAGIEIARISGNLHIFKRVGDNLIENLVSISGADCTSKEYIIEKGPE